jgi:chlorite dismutase
MKLGYAFAGGDAGPWRLLAMKPVRGDAGLVAAKAVDVVPARELKPSVPTSWVLRGLISNVRYATRPELTALKAIQQPLGRPDARRAALIPIKKSAAWWDLAQDERRAIFEDSSHHNTIGMQYLPAIARQLFHCRDLGEPFDFLTWFEYALEHAAAFEDLVGRLRASAEWGYVEREIDIRLERA